MGSVAVVADIEAMFHQVKVSPIDRNHLRFFRWPSEDIDKTPRLYRMTVHLFGATSSPSYASFAFNKNIEDNAEDYAKEVL